MLRSPNPSALQTPSGCRTNLSFLLVERNSNAPTASPKVGINKLTCGTKRQRTSGSSIKRAHQDLGPGNVAIDSYVNWTYERRGSLAAARLATYSLAG